MSNKDRTLFLKLADAAFDEEKRATEACRAHTKSCWVCRLGWLLSFFVQCRTGIYLLRAHMLAKRGADAYRLPVVLLQEQEVPTKVSVEWLENLYKM
jgi:hypothetical protein